MISFLEQDSNLNSIISFPRISNLFKQVCKNGSEADNNDTTTSFYRDNDIIFAWMVQRFNRNSATRCLSENQREDSIDRSRNANVYEEIRERNASTNTIKTRLERSSYILHLISVKSNAICY